jgi:hypothetical protein
LFYTFSEFASCWNCQSREREARQRGDEIEQVKIALELQSGIEAKQMVATEQEQRKVVTALEAKLSMQAGTAARERERSAALIGAAEQQAAEANVALEKARAELEKARAEYELEKARAEYELSAVLFEQAEAQQAEADAEVRQHCSHTIPYDTRIPRAYRL